MKKRLFFSLLAGVLFTATAASNAFAIFEFTSSEVKVENVDTNGINAYFSESTQTYFQVYFFASPYYATGSDLTDSDGNQITDPLEIANNENNPYNDDTPYCINHGSTDSTHATASYSDGTYYYYSAKSIDSSKLSKTATGVEAIDRYEKKKWSGYIMTNDTIGITKETSTYFALSCANNISSDDLSNVIAQSVFKDSWGFGPEFIGWTYNKELAAERCMYSSSERYGVTSGAYLVAADGSTESGTAYDIGNYGVQAVTTNAVISSQTSLAYIDSLTSDGSEKGDQIIYLYPIFAAKNNLKPKLINDKYTPFAKLRVNPGSEPENYQSDEIDYSVNRYTVPFQQTSVDNASISSSTTTARSYNYFADDVYVDSSLDIRFDINPIRTDYDDWSGSWVTLVTKSDLIGDLETGYYGFDIAYWTYTSNSSRYQSRALTTVQNTMTAFNNTNEYIKVIGSKSSSSSSSYGIYSSGGFYFAFVIGIRKEHNYRITGDDLNGSIDDYDSAYENRIYALNLSTSSSSTTSTTTSSKYYFSKNFYVDATDEISILNESSATTSTIGYSFSTMDDTNIEAINDRMEETGIYLNNNSNYYEAIGEGTPFTVSSDGKRLVANESGNYEFIFIVTRSNGTAKSINVAYRTSDVSYYIVLLSSKPTETFFNDINELTSNNDNLVAFVQISANMTADDSTTIFSDQNGDSVGTISEVLASAGKTKLFDSANDKEISLSLFTNNEFYLYHDYVLYLA